MLNSEFWTLWLKYFKKIIGPSIFATLRMVIATVTIGFALGFGLAILLTIYGPDGLNPKKKIYKLLDFLVNTIRSFPILILIVAISPLTRKIVGTTVGEKAAILPLSIAATAFIARMLENSFREVDKQLVEAARSFGATDMQIIFKIIVKESVPSIISIATMSTITYIASTTIAGAVGGGGLGAVALNYGYQSFNNSILYTSVFILFIMVIITQAIGSWLYKKFL
ncbi:methionine ABC transporter permease [Tissierella sp. MB52-C2]|uniref:methionine ABC transporter permease n=1 Tax=Tissierella sp. MB52-C2 TaxID=3070999 RepID=UPI00280B605B|nr:methionine ABC transporter permease [Tissierella sp. MB52-C2]WMM24433.1 methionine ABC transporter permease [Tissierella sp. MB52-C2]